MLSGLPYGLFMLMGGTLLLWDESSKAFNNQMFLSKYRALQVLEKLINSCVTTRIFPIVAVASPSVQIFCGFVIIEYHSSLEFLHFAALLIVVFTGVVFNLVLFGAGKRIYSKSLRELTAAKKASCQNKCQRRVVKSMMPLRIWFGSNYVDNLTPLVIQDFCMLQTNNLLLLS